MKIDKDMVEIVKNVVQIIGDYACVYCKNNMHGFINLSFVKKILRDTNLPIPQVCKDCADVFYLYKNFELEIDCVGDCSFCYLNMLKVCEGDRNE